MSVQFVAYDMDITSLDKVPARIEGCDHEVMVLRHRIGQEQPCGRCAAEGKTNTGRLVALAPLPPPRRHYREPKRRGFVSDEGFRNVRVRPIRETPAPKKPEAPDPYRPVKPQPYKPRPQTKPPKIGRPQVSADQVEAGKRFIRQEVEKHGWITIEDYQKRRPKNAAGARYLKGDEEWPAFVSRVAGVLAPHELAVIASEEGMKAYIREHGRSASWNWWRDNRPEHALSPMRLAKRVGMSWAEWVEKMKEEVDAESAARDGVSPGDGGAA